MQKIITSRALSLGRNVGFDNIYGLCQHIAERLFSCVNTREPWFRNELPPLPEDKFPLLASRYCWPWSPIGTDWYARLICMLLISSTLDRMRSDVQRIGYFFLCWLIISTIWGGGIYGQDACYMSGFWLLLHGAIYGCCPGWNNIWSNQPRMSLNEDTAYLSFFTDLAARITDVGARSNSGDSEFLPFARS